jgi:hypothetical protein
MEQAFYVRGSSSFVTHRQGRIDQRSIGKGAQKMNGIEKI